MSKEVILLMGFPCAGKSTLVEKYRKQGYARVNRDDLGGSMDQLNTRVEQLMETDVEKFVLDNTYGTKDQRARIIAIARKHGFKISCVHLNTSAEDAMFNSATRIVRGFNDKGHDLNDLLGPKGSELVKDTDNIPAIAIFAYKKSFEKPTKDEGFDRIEKVEFERIHEPEYSNKAIFLDYDDTLRKTISGAKFPIDAYDIEILPNRTETLKAWQKMGYRLLGVSNQSGIEKGTLSRDSAIACFERTNELLGIDIEYRFCPHHSFPIRCYCRKPLQGLGVYFIEKYKLDPVACTMIGDQTSDKTFASRCGMGFHHADNWFSLIHD